MASSDVPVAAPAAVPIDFTISGLVPNTITMQNAIKTSLQVLFDEYVDVGTSVASPSYLSAIWQTVDLTTGDMVQAFTIPSPSGTITVTSDQIAQLGNVTFT